ncbi:MAG: Gfo/Idh/MocA family oxidoreductase [Planctomycetota bacterium]
MGGKVLKVGVIGVGLQGESHVEKFQSFDNSRVVAVADINKKRVQQVAKKYNIPHAFSDYRDLLALKDVEAVSIVLPDHLHLEPGLAAAKARKHILMEKPIATSVADGEKIVAAVKKAKVRFMINFSNRWWPQMRLTKAKFDAGELGDPVYAYARLNNTIYVPTKMLKGWSRHTRLPHWLMSHTIDRVRWLWGSEVKRVYGVCRKGHLKKLGFDTPDAYHATIEFRNGAIAAFESVWIMPETLPYMVDSQMELLFTEASVIINTVVSGTEMATTKEKFSYPRMASQSYTGRPQGFVADALQHFVDCMIAGRNPEPTADDALAVLRATAAVVESAEKREPIDL